MAKYTKPHTDSDWIVHIFRSHHVAQEDAGFDTCLSTRLRVVIVLVKDDTRRIEDTNSTLELNGLHILGMPRLSSDSAHLDDARRIVVKSEKSV
jgi:hypothetical protein